MHSIPPRHEPFLIRLAVLTALLPAGRQTARAELTVGVVETPVRGASLSDGRLVLRLAEQPEGVAVAAAADHGWLGWLTRTPDGAWILDAPELEVAPRPIRAWRVDPAALTRSVFGDATQQPFVTNMGPGLRGAWIRTRGDRPDQGVWWLRQAGQPVAWFEALWRRDADVYARVTLLAADLNLRSGSVLEAWPSRLDELAGELSSAVAHVEQHEGGRRIWVARVPAVLPELARVVFASRSGKPGGSGQIEGADSRFWYVRPIEPFSEVPVEVGDDAWIRSAEQDVGRLVGRPFREGDRWLIDLGEVDGLSDASRLGVYRAGQWIADLELDDLQTTYARPAGAAELQESDTIVVRAPGRSAGVVLRVPADGLFEVAVDAGAVMPVEAVCVYDEAGLAGAAWIVAGVDGAALAVSAPGSYRRAPALGQRVTPAPAQSPAAAQTKVESGGPH